jgi:hypothetical protein
MSDYNLRDVVSDLIERLMVAAIKSAESIKLADDRAGLLVEAEKHAEKFRAFVNQANENNIEIGKKIDGQDARVRVLQKKAAAMKVAITVLVKAANAFLSESHKKWPHGRKKLAKELFVAIDAALPYTDRIPF